jgi:hypothetical protein
MHLSNHCIKLSQFPAPWKVAKVLTLSKPGKDPTFSHILRPSSLLSPAGKVFEKVYKKLSKGTLLKEPC